MICSQRAEEERRRQIVRHEIKNAKNETHFFSALMKVHGHHSGTIGDAGSVHVICQMTEINARSLATRRPDPESVRMPNLVLVLTRVLVHLPVCNGNSWSGTGSR